MHFFPLNYEMKLGYLRTIQIWQSTPWPNMKLTKVTHESNSGHISGKNMSYATHMPICKEQIEFCKN